MAELRSAGDGKVTQKDILKGRGVPGFGYGGTHKKMVNGNLRIQSFDLDAADIIGEAYERCGLEVRTGGGAPPVGLI